ncbi:MAG: GNAT family N-acetyltransferase [Sarcina sp.]
MIIREYKESDCKEITELFYNTVHTINSRDYSKKQLAVWARDTINLEEWNSSLKKNYTLVAVEDNIIVGFGDMSKVGYLDRLYVHKDYQGRGIATDICDKLEKKIIGSIVTHASITAKLFFEKRNYKVLRQQQVERHGIILINYVMKKF